MYIHASELAVAAQQISAQAEQLSPLGDGDEVSVGSVRLRVVHTPGHSPGSILLIATTDDGQQLDADNLVESPAFKDSITAFGEICELRRHCRPCAAASLPCILCLLQTQAGTEP